MIKIIATAAAGIATGYASHMIADPLIAELEKGANRTGWYLLMRYTVGSLGVLFYGVGAMYATLPRRQYEWHEIPREAGMAYLSSLVMFGGGVALARAAKGLRG